MNVQAVPRARLRRMASRLNDPTHSGHTYCLKPGRVPEGLELPEEAASAMSSSETGSFLFWSLGGSHLVLPPFPVEREDDFPGWRTGPLQSLLDRPRTVLVLLLRLGGAAVGIFEGERLVTSKVTTAFVKGRHKKGGSSSGRFARRHDEQARGLFDKACDVLRGQVESYEGRIESFLRGGDRLTLQSFEKRCPYIKRFDSVRLSRVLDVPDPRLAVLRDVSRLMYFSRFVSFG